jgi:hypothetical protein
MHEVGMKLGSCNNTFFINACLLFKKCAIARPDPNDVAHKEQYTHHCFLKTIDEVSKYEMEAYDNEIYSLKYHYANLECD